jgi:hypothetical protein
MLSGQDAPCGSFYGSELALYLAASSLPAPVDQGGSPLIGRTIRPKLAAENLKECATHREIERIMKSPMLHMHTSRIV